MGDDDDLRFGDVSSTDSSDGGSGGLIFDIFRGIILLLVFTYAILAVIEILFNVDMPFVEMSAWLILSSTFATKAKTKPTTP